MSPRVEFGADAVVAHAVDAVTADEEERRGDEQRHREALGIEERDGEEHQPDLRARHAEHLVVEED